MNLNSTHLYNSLKTQQVPGQCMSISLLNLRLCHNRCEPFLSVIFHVHIYLFLFKNHVVLQIKYFLHKNTLFKCYDFRIPSFIPIHLIISPFLHYIEFLNLTVIFMDIFYFPLSIGLLSAISQGRLTRSFLYFPNTFQK